MIYRSADPCNVPDVRRGIRGLVLVGVPTVGALMLWSRGLSGVNSLGMRLEWHFLAAMLVLAAVKWLVDSWRLQLVVCAAGARISRLRSFQLLIASMFGANVTPFFVGGLATQVYFLSLSSASPGPSVAIAAIYAILNLVVKSH